MALNPHKNNKIDINSLSPEEQRLFRLYGKLPSRSDHFAKHLKERKYFDSGDYAMSKAGKGDGVDTGSVGSQHPVPEKIPHLSSPPTTGAGSNGPGGVGGITLGIPGGAIHQPSGSPVKESSFLHRETSASDLEEGGAGATATATTTGAAATTATTTTSAAVPSPATGTPLGQGRTESIPIRR